MIGPFMGRYRFLSNFWPATIEFEGTVFPTAEHAYQAAKTIHPTERQYIAALPSPGEAKRKGRLLVLRSDWVAIQKNVMKTILRYKFTQHPELTQELLRTGNEELVEINTWNDTYWGVCNGVGGNELGKILMKIREEVRSGNYVRVNAVGGA